MSAAQSEISTILMDKVADWLTQSSLAGDDLETLVRGFCERLAAAGLPLMRVHLSFSMLHPLYDALGFTWRRGRGIEVEGFRKKAGGPSDRFARSPYYHLFSNNLDHLRRRINPEMPSEFPIFDELKLIGVTDYMAFVHPFGSDSGQGMIGSWSTDSPAGFSESMIAALLYMQSHLAVASKMAVLHKLTDNMLKTYLGGDAGKRVLNGQIKRGEGDTIRAALVMADMRNSTKLAETAGRDLYIETLNQYFDAIAAPFNRAGGQILSFLGDGFLAVYPCERHRAPSETACQAALAAAHKATSRMAELNARRSQQGLSEIGYGIGLHVGNVMFGNVGLSDRLTFSVFGSAVNEVQRLQDLTKKSQYHLIASQEFANYCGNGTWVTIGEEKLAGVREKFTVLFPELTEASLGDEDGGLEATYDRISDAEQVILLHRDARKLPPSSPHSKDFQ
ncbi:adenylate/guanylate cyclase domain-containing protein [Phyllobacterium phragmitis]|uniref:Adenylate/guanylate cyclase domain-containing protein n=1 Tax=Phyllobacterium phragmitis TaxID=2670329 RepID=A0A2S9IPR4_9HYPH|nr:adenylate/guanylate cyclase domain-containing protein [Phyllobacterium phragmitis]PRD42482.1 adenylate/guanylate cyclase domain-containing protein [Phyllobacterium phragmitis]